MRVVILSYWCAAPSTQHNREQMCAVDTTDITPNSKVWYECCECYGCAMLCCNDLVEHHDGVLQLHSSSPADGRVE